VLTIHRVGDRVGVGAQSASCLQPDCPECSDGLENHCLRNFVGTYDSKYQDGSKSYGGYADYCRVSSHFVIKIPDMLSSQEAAPMLCGGVTTYSPLKQNGAGPGKSVGIVGIGGLGHFGLLWAKVRALCIVCRPGPCRRRSLTCMHLGPGLQGNRSHQPQQPEEERRDGNGGDQVHCDR
jgi:D-arabinose 1-dehydrogenase-like Zn-dependent alcohol dehydrogenase